MIKDIGKNTFEVNIGGDTVEIGGKASVDFLPHLKLNRFRGLSSLEVAIPTEQKNLPIISGDTIIWEGKTIDGSEYRAKMYSLPAEWRFEGGAYELEISINKRPSSNVIPLLFKANNLVGYFQPPLTQREIDLGAERPEDIVNSWVFKHPTRGGVVTPSEVAIGMITGKAWHIPRPKLVDAVGDWTWGLPMFDPVRGLWTVTVDQDFINRAHYPIRHLVGDTFGHTADSGSVVAAPSRIYANNYTGAAGTGTSMSVFGREKNGDGEFKGALYLDSDDSKVDETALGNMVVGNSWVQVNFSGSPAVSAVTYAVGCYIGNEGGNNNGISLGYDSGALTPYQHTGLTPFTYPDPWTPADVGTDWDFGVYVTYTPGGAALTKSLSDSVAISDSISKSFGGFKADSVSLADSLSKGMGLAKADSAAIAENLVKVIGLVKAETITISDSLSKAMGLIKTDAVAIADSISKAVSIVKAETVAIADNIATSLGAIHLLSLFDTVTITDSITKAVGVVKADTLTITDSIGKGLSIILSDAVTITESVTGVIYTCVRQQIARMDTMRLTASRMAVERWRVSPMCRIIRRLL